MLRQLRQESEKTLGALARHLAVSVTYLSDVERDQRPPLSRERIQQTAQFLGIDAAPLLESAAATAGAFELETPGSDTGRAAGAALMRGWSDLDDDDYVEVIELIERVKKRKKKT
jgi:transcriptional regulator with XRE-family HTH domain